MSEHVTTINCLKLKLTSVLALRPGHQCPDGCAATAGLRHRDVQCIDSQSKRPLRPFHCQAVSSRPIGTLTCPHKPCVAWSVSPWGPVGSDEQARLGGRLHCTAVVLAEGDAVVAAVASAVASEQEGSANQSELRHGGMCDVATPRRRDGSVTSSRHFSFSLSATQCAGSCGEGMRERLVYCPAPHRCNATLRPNSTEACALKPCARWQAEDWDEVSRARS